MTGPCKTALICLSLLFALVLGSRAALEAQGTASPASSGSGEVKLEDGTRRSVHYESPKKYKGEKISIDFQNEEIRNIIKAIEKVSGKKIVIPDNVSGRMTIKLRDAPWDQALDIVLAARNLGVEESGDTLTVYDLPTFGCGGSRGGRLSRQDSQPVVINKLDKKVFTPKYAPIGHVAAELKKLQSERGKMVAIGNDIYVEDELAAIATMSQIFMRIDRVPRQILIEARIVEADAAFREALAAAWKSNPPEPGRAMKETGEGEAQAKPAAIAYDFVSKDKFQHLNAILADADGAGPTRTLSAPRIMAVNDQEVNIKQGDQKPYVSGRSANTTCGPTFKEVVMELIAKPHTEEDGQSLTFDLEISSESTNSRRPEAYADIREAVARLQLQSGQTIVIGGLATDGSKGPEGGPANGRSGSISDWLFKDHAAKNIEMLIFLTATIVPAKI